MVMTLKRARFLFDLNGYIVIRNVLSAEELAQANAAIDRHRGEFAERSEDIVRNTPSGTRKELAGDGTTGRLDLGGMLGWSEKQDRDVFRQMLVHEKLVPYFHMLLGTGYRLDHSPLVICQKYGSEGFSLHGGPVLEDGQMNRDLLYACHGEQVHNSLVAASFQLSDHNQGDGGFCVVRGSHKMNFPMSPEMKNGEDEEFLRDYVVQPETKAGDVVIFSEATVHGSLAWTVENRERRIALYRFAPSNFAYARGYSEGWPSSYLDGMTPEQLGVMCPPYNSRFDRPLLDEFGKSANPKTRDPEKKAFDKKVFGVEYF